MREMPRDEKGRYEARVLVVEDDPILRTHLRHMVAKHVTEVREAPDGASGLEIWWSWMPDLVITDIMMPVMNGMEMSAAIKRSDGSAQVIVVTSSSDVEHLRWALDVGVERYVMKPVDEALLQDAITKCLRDLQQTRKLHLSRMVFESVSEGLVVTDEKGHILAVNPYFCEVTGYREEEVLGRSPSLLSSGQHDAAFYQTMWNTLDSVGRWAGEIVNRRKNGETYTEWLSIVAVEEPNNRGSRFVGMFSDITERKREEDHIRRLAHFDTLTGLPNRVMFMDRLKRSLSRLHRHGGELALLYLDLDKFKPVNDVYGHAIGDLVLIEAAKRMNSCIRDMDMVSRRGGDEFVVLIEADNVRDAAALVARKLIQTVSQPYRVDGHEVGIGASVGIAVFPDDGKDADSLIHAADISLYNAKGQGRGAFRFFQDADQEKVSTRLDMQGALLQGLKDDGFELRYLPEISLITGRVERLEALLRFHHPTQGMLEAGRFLETAERLGIMPQVGMRSIQSAIQTLGALGLNDVDLSLDISAKQLEALVDLDPILGWLNEAGLSTERLTFEFPEWVVMGNEEVLRVLYDLRTSGFHCALDDFGAGYCSFNLMRQLPLSSLKIDLAFIEEIEVSAQFRELVGALVAFGKRLGLRTVAEGVSTPAQLAFLRENGCDAVQGFLFGEPMAAEDLPGFFREQPWWRHF